MKNNNQKHISQWNMLECDLINQEFEEQHQIIVRLIQIQILKYLIYILLQFIKVNYDISVPQFPKFKKPTYNQIQITTNIQYRINVCSPAKLDDTVSISTKKSTTNSQAGSCNYIVNHYIQQIKDHFNKNTRQETEAQIIRNLISQKAKAVYMLDIKWAANYTAFLQNQHLIIPSEISTIDNSIIFDFTSLKNPIYFLNSQIKIQRQLKPQVSTLLIYLQQN